MSIEQKLEQEIQKTEKKINEISHQLKKLNEEYQDLLEKFKYTSQLNEEDLPGSLSRELEIEEKRLEEMLSLELENVRNPNQTKKNLAEQAQVQKHWLFVR